MGIGFLKKKIFFGGLLIIVASLFFIAGYFYFKKENNSFVKQLYTHELDITFGTDTAPLQMFLFFRYDCIYCRKFFTDVFPMLEKEFIGQGKVKLVLKLVNLTNDEPVQNALKTMICLNRFGNFEPLHQLLLVEPKVVYTHEFEKTTQELINNDEFVAECMFSGVAENYLLSNRLDFNRLGLKGTPTFIINNRIYKGFKTYENLKIVIEKELNTVLR